ncbi:TetR/AcrR family transcriptional regulator [Dactylosporangium siamense]|uniref:TetR family transcriptional regulator n=1 Tax=Dactylosporangium siamense TaxID=685454 RepID=A0A919PH87_9ACTN|nr:TetR/AcrR family transcriptional regulator [Dactylosporangium siamense]GIG44791.1 TetR family transcriptional regulator [Dactylosporangium siamense]
MPRGVAIPEPRQQLFAALERVIAGFATATATGDSPARLTGRAVTREAGVATGLLYTHFTDFDAFLTGYAVDRAFQLAGAVAGLPSRAGSGRVAGNLGDALLATPLTTLAAFTRLTAFRPDLNPGVEAVLGTGGLQAVERTVADYLAAEQRLGRVPADAEPQALALVVVGVLHHVALTTAPDPAADTLIRSAMAALTAGFPAVAPS